MNPTPRASQPCPCGSGRKYKDCCAAKQQARRRLVRRSKRLLAWAGGISVAVALVYGLSLTSGVAYGEKDLGVIDFSALNQKQKRTALQAANGAHCTCGCGLTLAECVATDCTCPIRSANIDTIRSMVKQAGTE